MARTWDPCKCSELHFGALVARTWDPCKCPELHFAVLVASLPLIAHGNIVIVNNDSAGEGFNDNTPVSTVGGNTGITLGEQRLNVFQRAADILNNTFDISAVVRVGSSFDPLECYPYSAVLGQAGPAALEFDSNTRNVTPHALYNQQVGYDADNSEVEITAQFNSSIVF